jgi:hypothetical protein
MKNGAPVQTLDSVSRGEFISQLTQASSTRNISGSEQVVDLHGANFSVGRTLNH